MIIFYAKKSHYFFSNLGLGINIFLPSKIIWLINFILIFIFILMVEQTNPRAQKNDGLGKNLFNLVWTDSIDESLDGNGLGPLYNASSCVSCHPKNSRVGPPRLIGEKALGMLVRISVKNNLNQEVPHPKYGTQINTFSVKDFPAEGVIYVTWEYKNGTYGDGESWQLRRPVLLFSELAYGPIDSSVLRSARVPPSLNTSGKIEKVNDSSIITGADPDDLDGDNISGRPNFVRSKITGSNQIGRFGWKAGKYNLKEQVATALIEDMGITNSIYPKQICPLIDINCKTKNNNRTSLELNDKGLLSLVKYISNIDKENSNIINNQASSIEKLGKSLFIRSSCDSCHVPHLKGKNGENVVLYSDLLLHDMGEGLADQRREFEATGREWRTAPLVGLSNLFSPNNKISLLHDGRARGFSEAILWHGGEAMDSRENFRLMEKKEREALLSYLESL